MNKTNHSYFRVFPSLTLTKRVGISFLLLMGLIVLAVSLLYAGMSARRPYIGLDLALTPSGWAVQAVDSTGSAASAGIQVGDRPVQINGQPAEVFLSSYETSGLVWGPLIQELTVLDNAGRLTSVTLLGQSPSTQSGVELGMRLLACVILWLIGFLVFLKRPQNLAAILFYGCCSVIALVLSTNLATARGVPTAAYVELVATVIGPWLLLHFFLTLPEERRWARDSLKVGLLYLPAAVTLILTPFLAFDSGQPVAWFRSLRFFEYGAGFLACSVVAFLNYFGSQSFRTRQQMKILLISCLVALIPLLLINVLPQAIWRNQTILPAGFSTLFIVVIPLGMSYAIVSRQLLDIDVIIRRGVIYVLISLGMAALLSIAIFLALALRHTILVGEEILLALVLGGLATALFGPTKAGVEHIVDKFLYKDRFDYRQIIQSLSISLNFARDLTEVSRVIVGTVVNTLNLAGGALFVKTSSGAYEISATQGFYNESDNQLKLTQRLSQDQPPPLFPNPASSANPPVEFFLPLVAGEKEVAMLCLSPKANRQSFSHADLFLLQGLQPVASMAVQRAMLVRDVSVSSTFVSIASHELRTPLTSIVGYADLLIQRDPPAIKRQIWLKKILDNGQKLTAMVNDLLNVTRIQSGKLALKIEKLELMQVLSERLDIARETAPQHELIIDVDPDLPDVNADRDKLGQVVSNLLSNAIKYSPGGGKIILAARHDSQRQRVVISLADQGIGISPQDKDSLFTTFHRIQRPETQGIRGSGLGLYIAKSWTEAMGGEIWCQSELNRGSTFFVALPACYSHNSPGAELIREEKN
jgi:signal transduction histidine kinase